MDQLVKRTLIFVKGFRQLLLTLTLVASVTQAESARAQTSAAPKFRVLALAESGGHHVEFTKAARPWLKKCFWAVSPCEFAALRRGCLIRTYGARRSIFQVESG
jgi:hypothetical protein